MRIEWKKAVVWQSFLFLGNRCLAKRYGTQVVFVDPFFPSSQLCNDCGCQNPELKNLKIRGWICPVCGEYHERDLNAAKNIHDEGGRALAGLTEFKNFEIIG